MKFTNHIVIALALVVDTVKGQAAISGRGGNKNEIFVPGPFYQPPFATQFPCGFEFKDPDDQEKQGGEILTVTSIVAGEEGSHTRPNDYNFVIEYVSITDASNVGTTFPNNLALIGSQLAQSSGGAPIPFPESSRSLLGTVLYTSGDVYDSVELELESDNNGSNNANFVGGRQIILGSQVPLSATPFFTFRGQCTTVADQATAGPKTTGSRQFAEIKAHTCLYDLCIGTIDDCFLIYSGTPFIFDITANVLPPAFPAFIVGGTGEFAAQEGFEGIKGTVDILTVTGRSKLTVAGGVNGLIGTDTIFPKTATSPLSDPGAAFTAQTGFITQKIFIQSNIQLPSVCRAANLAAGSVVGGC